MASMNKVFSAYEQRCKVLERTQATNPYAKGVALIEGQLVPLHEARIPLLDQGFLHSDLTYDVPGVWDGRFFRLDDHLERFSSSCDKLRLTLPMSKEAIKTKLVEMVGKSGLRDAYVELICTRGLTSVREQLSSPTGSMGTGTLYLFIMPYLWVMSPQLQMSGSGSAVVTRTVRRTPPGAFDPTIKNLQWGDLTRGLLEAMDRGAMYPFLTDGDGNLTEGSGYNICIIRNGILYTPDRGVLEGVTRKTVLEVAKGLGVECRVQIVPVAWVYEAEEVFMCTTAGGVMPITKLDGEKVGDGKVGKVTGRIWDGYWERHYDGGLSFEVGYEDAGKSRL